VGGWVVSAMFFHFLGDDIFSEVDCLDKYFSIKISNFMLVAM
jgi:hypothetical protein